MRVHVPSTSLAPCCADATGGWGRLSGATALEFGGRLPSGRAADSIHPTGMVVRDAGVECVPRHDMYRDLFRPAGRRLRTAPVTLAACTVHVLETPDLAGWELLKVKPWLEGLPATLNLELGRRAA